MATAPRNNGRGKSAIIIGAGLGGLALAIRLQSAGVATVVVEARERPGGLADSWQQEGFTFDAGPTVLTDPDGLGELWRLTGHDMSRDLTLVPVQPFYRLSWADGTSFDYSHDETLFRQEVARIDAADLPGYERFLDHSATLCRDGYRKLAAMPFPDFAAMAKAAPLFAQTQAWRPVHAVVSRFVRNEKLRQALSFQTLLRGGNPLTASGLHALVPRLEKDSGLFYPRGGMGQLAAAMVAQFERLGGLLRLGDPATRIETMGDRVTGVETRAGWRGEADVVVSDADLVHSYGTLLADHARGRAMADKIARKRWSPSWFALHFGLRGTWPGIPQHMVMFGPRYEELLTDVFEHGVLSGDLSLFLHHPTVTDPDLAPEGSSVFRALVPVPHMGKLPVDWAALSQAYADRILNEIERRLIPDIRSRLVTSRICTPPDFAVDFGVFRGSGGALEPLASQSAWLRPHNHDDVLSNLYLVGAGTHPGAGIAGVLSGAAITSRLILENPA